MNWNLVIFLVPNDGFWGVLWQFSDFFVGNSIDCGVSSGHVASTIIAAVVGSSAIELSMLLGNKSTSNYYSILKTYVLKISKAIGFIYYFIKVLKNSWII